jgi:hypothetical protein
MLKNVAINNNKIISTLVFCVEGAAPFIMPFPVGVGEAVFGTVLGPLSTVESVSGFLQAVLVLTLLRAMDGQTTAALGD